MLLSAILTAVAVFVLVVAVITRRRRSARGHAVARPYSGPPRSSVRVLDRDEEPEAARRALRREEELRRRVEAHQERLRRMTG